MDIIYVRQKLHADRIFIKDNSATIIAWIQDWSEQHQIHHLLRDIWHFLRSSVSLTVQHIFRETNSTTYWVASFFAEHSADWSWHHGDSIPLPLHELLLFDLIGGSRIWFV